MPPCFLSLSPSSLHRRRASLETQSHRSPFRRYQILRSSHRILRSLSRSRYPRAHSRFNHVELHLPLSSRLTGHPQLRPRDQIKDLRRPLPLVRFPLPPFNQQKHFSITLQAHHPPPPGHPPGPHPLPSGWPRFLQHHPPPPSRRRPFPCHPSLYQRYGGVTGLPHRGC